MRTAIDPDLSTLIGGRSWSGAGAAVRRVRDLTLIDLGERTMVVATDSNAAIGDKPADFLAQDPVLTGYSAAKVPLMEVLAAGATPILLIDNLCVELQPTGVRIIEGIRLALQDAGVDVLITGSDESNMPTVQTGVGVTVLGLAEPGDLRVGRLRPGDEIWVVGARASGLPGDEYDARGEGIATVSDVIATLELPGVREVLPVGSHGIRYECEALAAEAGVTLDWQPGVGVDLRASAGASTCFLAGCAPGAGVALRSIGLPLELVATAAASPQER